MNGILNKIKDFCGGIGMYGRWMDKISLDVTSEEIEKYLEEEKKQ